MKTFEIWEVKVKLLGIRFHSLSEKAGKLLFLYFN